MADSKKTLQDIKAEIEAELKKQRDSKAEIKKAQSELRDLRQKKADIAEERSRNEEAIRAMKVELAEDRQIARDAELPESVREAAKERVQENNIAITGRRRDISKQDAQISGLNTKVQKSLGSKEYNESLLASSRTNQRETTSRGRMMEAVDSLTPQALRNDLSKNIAPDTQLEAMRSGESVRKMGGNRSEQQQAQQASAEFAGLFAAIKETKKALAGLTEGTEEHARKQEELVLIEGQATEALTRLAKVERDVEKRKLAGGGGPGGGGMAGAAAAAMTQAGQFGNNMLSSMGPLATDRYVLEEQKKQAQLNLRNMSLTDIRNSTTDATSFLSSGGGDMFGAETPFGKKGGVNKGIQDLGEDYANTQRALPQYALGMRAMQGLGTAATNIIGDTAQATAINPITGAPISGAGAAMKHLGQWGMNTAMDAANTPEFAAGMGGKEAANFVRSANDTVIGGATELAQGTMGSLISQGGGNGDQMVKGVGGVGSGMNKLANALPNVYSRGLEAVDERQTLVNTEQQAAQVGRVRERLSMAYAPAMQQYMDTQPTMRATMRQRSMDKGEREGYERELETFSTDKDLGNRGFGVNEILGNNASAAQGLGRFGAGGMNERVSKTGMIAESMGLGGAQQNIRAMAGMSANGSDDAEAMFTKAMKEGLQKGLQDSRQFQELLASAAATADGVGDFEGAIKGITMFAGSGRANDVTTASAAAKTAEERMSGKTGTWRDMVKFDVTNKAAKGAIDAAQKKGIDLTREDRTSLQNLANVDVKQLENPEFISSILTSGARKAIEATGQTVEEYGSKLATNLRVQGTMGDAINATQSPELAELRNNLANGNIDAIKKKYKDNPQRLKDLVALAGSGATAQGDAKDAAGAQQMIINQLDAGGINTDGMGMQRDFKQKDFATAMAESEAANTGGEQSARGSAQISQKNMSTANAVTRDKDGNNLFAKRQSEVGERYGQQSDDMIKNTSDMRTVQPEKRVERIDDAVKEIVQGLQDIKESFKNFSPKDMVINAGKDIVIQGASAIKGVMLDNALTQAASEAGSVIADKVRDAFSSDRSSNSAPAAKASGPAKSVPTP